MFHGVDKPLLILTFLLVVVGYFIFSSASLGLLAREGATFSSVAFTQFLFGIVGGTIALTITSSIHYRHWRKYAFYIFGATVFLTLLVYTPLALQLETTDAKRWVAIGGFSFQPAEFLKLGAIIYMATWLSGTYRSITQLKRGVLPFVGFVAFIGLILVMQPDIDSFLIIGAALTAMFIVAGGRWRDFFGMVALGIVLAGMLLLAFPYVKDRITTFMDPSSDPLGSGYQIQQSLIAIGSGGLSGRGFGQSIQKFEYLPEPIGDSIFAVYAEEFGFIGSTLLVLLFTAFTFRGYKVATQAQDLFGMLLVVGFMTMIVSQAFLNIAAMLSLAPLSGLPLPFISHGGTALLATLAAIGIVLNVSKFKKGRKAS